MTAYYFEDFQVGDEYVSPSRTITEADIVNFAGVSGDYNPLHTDKVYAENTVFGERIAHGLLGLCVAAGLKSRLGYFDGTVVAFLGLNWKFQKPIKIGDTIKVIVKINEKRETKKPDRGIIVQGMSVVNQDGETVQEGEQFLMVRRKQVQSNT